MLPDGVEVWKHLEKEIDRNKLLQYPCARTGKKTHIRKVRARIVLVRDHVQVHARWEFVSPKHNSTIDGKYPSNGEYSPRYLTYLHTGFDERAPPPTQNHFHMREDSLVDTQYPSWPQRNRYGTQVSSSRARPGHFTPANARRDPVMPTPDTETTSTPVRNDRSSSAEAESSEVEADNIADEDYGARRKRKKPQRRQDKRARED